MINNGRGDRGGRIAKFGKSMLTGPVIQSQLTDTIDTPSLLNGAGHSPLTVGNLKCWHDFSNLGLAHGASGPATVLDSGPNGINASRAGVVWYQTPIPEINNKGMLLWGPGGYYYFALATPGNDFPQPYTMVAVWRPGGVGSEIYTVDNDGQYFLATSTTQGTGWRLDFSISGSGFYADRFVPGRWYWTAVVGNGANSKIYINSLTPTTGDAGTLTFSTASSPAKAGILMGWRHGNMAVAENSVYGAALTAGQLAALARYHNEKYGLNIMV